MIYTRKQEKIAKKIEEQSGISNWKDWKWQMKHKKACTYKYTTH